MSEKKKRPVVRKPGRPPKVDRTVLFDILKKYKKRMCPCGDGTKLAPRKNSVWQDIANEINNVRSPSSLLAYVSNNSHGVRKTLWTNFKRIDVSDGEPEPKSNDSVPVRDPLAISTSSRNGSSDDTCTITFTIYIQANDFDGLVETRVICLRNKQKRIVKRFVKGRWQDFILQKIWKNTRLKCNWNLKCQRLNVDCTSGAIHGVCKCSSRLNCIIERNEDGMVALVCSVVSAKGKIKCGKRFSRRSSTAKLPNESQSKSAQEIDERTASVMMEENEPTVANLPQAVTMSVMEKSQHREPAFLRPDSIGTLDILKCSTMKNEITWISNDPFFVHYATNHQRAIYEKVRTQEHTTLAIGSTGSICSPITRGGGSTSGALSLYIAVFRSVSNSYPVGQMITEDHTAFAIEVWLKRCIKQNGSAPPREIVCDFSSNFLQATVSSFSRTMTVNQYADMFIVDSNITPSCYIRIDVAHVMKIFSNFMRGVADVVSKFYKFGIGKLVLCRNMQDAERLVRALLTVARSKYTGRLTDGGMSACHKQKEFLQTVITTNVMEDLGLDDDFYERNESADLAEDESQSESSQWRVWAQNIDAAVHLNILHSPGTEVNDHWLPIFADGLIEKLKWLPLWSCVTRDRHGYGSCPASSSSVENEFQLIRNVLLEGIALPIRPDEFIPIHKRYIDGIRELNGSENETDRQRFTERDTEESGINNDAWMPHKTSYILSNAYYLPIKEEVDADYTFFTSLQ